MTLIQFRKILPYFSFEDLIKANLLAHLAMEIAAFIQTINNFNALKIFREFLLGKVIFFLYQNKSTKSTFLGLGIVEVGSRITVFDSS